MARNNGLAVVLLGRPHNLLSPEMSKGILELFAAQGVKTFSQDMVPYARDDVEEISQLLGQIHWQHAAKILEVACVAAKTPGLYPVYLRPSNALRIASPWSISSALRMLAISRIWSCNSTTTTPLSAMRQGSKRAWLPS
jgi:hypothetical protein